MSAHKRSVEHHWYRDAFGPLYAVTYAHRSLDAAGEEARFAAACVGLRPGERVLDLCCGNGRHLVHLQRCTPDVVGLDYSAEQIAVARELLGAPQRLVRADMRALPFVDAFDAVMNFFTSFGYFHAEDDNLRVVQGVARALRPAGRFFIDYVNAAHVERTLVPQSERTEAGYTITETRWIDREYHRINKTTRFSRAGRLVQEWGESVRLYTEAELRELLAHGGLRVDAVYGDYSGAPLNLDRPRMIMIGHRI